MSIKKLAILVFIIIPLLGFSQDIQSCCSSDFNKEMTIAGELRQAMLYPSSSGNSDGIIRQTAVENASLKSPVLGIAMSALVPGTGEMYAGKWLKGAIFLGVEVALWVGYAHYSDEGQKWEDIFHEYADTHWSEDVWRAWMAANPTFGDTTHTLPSTKTQQYYEMIGKYNQFKAGWDDYVEGGPQLTENRNHYEGLRHESNVQFKRASYCAMVVILNHLLSTFDTAFTIRGHNREVRSALRASFRQTRDAVVPRLSLNMQW